LEDIAMKRYLISTTVVLAVLLAALVVFGQEKGKTTPAGEGAKEKGIRPADVNRPTTPEGRPARPRGMMREDQMKVIAAIEEQVAKLKALVEAQPGPDEFAKMRDLPDGEERTKLREKFAKAREERQGVIEVIEQNIAKLRGGRPRIEEQQQLIDELQAIRELAKQEKAEETTKRLGQLIDRQQKGPEGRFPGSPGREGPRGEGAGTVAPSPRPPTPPTPPPQPEPGKKPQ
jgi:hypothetical protein